MYTPKLLVLAFLFCSLNAFASDDQPKLGKPASAKLISQWNQDIFPDGQGLPIGKGTASYGKKVYKKYCVSCHGVDGTGNSADELAGASHSLTDNPPDKIIGTYWPYATTIFDFTRRSMPLNAPGTLSTNELYAVTAYLLYLNGIIDQNKIINEITLPKITMPNRDGFINVYQLEEQEK